MARTKNPPAELVPDAALNEEVLQAPATLAAMTQSLSEERDLANQLLGQIQMSRAISKFTDVVSLQKLKHIKETKMYRALAGQKGFDRDGNEIADVGTFDGFCRALGTSASKVDEDLANLNAFGEEALQQLSQIGAGYRELRQYRRLPEDEKTALIEVAKAGDPAAFLDLAEELIAKHAKEKETLAKQVEDATADLDVTREILADEKAAHSQTKIDLQKAARRIERLSAEEAERELRKEAAIVAFEAEVAVAGNLRQVCTTMIEHAEQSGGDCRSYLAGMVRHIELQLAALRDEFALPEADGEEEFAFLRDLPTADAMTVEG